LYILYCSIDLKYLGLPITAISALIIFICIGSIKIRTIGVHLSKVFAFFLAFPDDSQFMFNCVYNPAILWQVIQTQNNPDLIQMVTDILMIPLVTC